MATKDIGAGTLNTSTNWIAEEWSIWQRFFRQRGGASSLGAAKKDWMLEKLREDEPELADKIEAIRAERERMKRNAVYVCLTVICLSLLQGTDILRAGRAKRTRRDDVAEIQNFEEEV